MEPIINSLLENDSYKFSMGQVIYHQFSDYKTTWSFKCRNQDVKFTDEMVNEIKNQIDHYCTLKFTEDELSYLNNTMKWIKGSYIDFLRLWHPRSEDITISLNDGQLEIEAAGTWLNTSMYEIPILAIVNEVYFKFQYEYDKLFDGFKQKLLDKVKDLNSSRYQISTFSEFGLRRRLSGEAQKLVVETLADKSNSFYEHSHFVGTSNVYLAKKFNLTPVGTMAHEFIMCVGQGNHKHKNSGE